MEVLSETENKVLAALIKDSSRTFAEIAKELNLSRQAVAYNVSSLKKKGVIKRFTVDVDHGKLGIGLPIILLAKMKHLGAGDFKKIIEVPALKDSGNVEDIFTLSGEFAFGVFGWWANKEDYGIWKTELIDQFEEIKPGFFPLIELDEFVIWDHYKHRGLFEIPVHLKKYLGRQ
jgi:DNA-binding Lrp family transcriptional regulator